MFDIEAMHGGCSDFLSKIKIVPIMKMSQINGLIFKVFGKCPNSHTAYPHLRPWE